MPLRTLLLLIRFDQLLQKISCMIWMFGIPSKHMNYALDTPRFWKRYRSLGPDIKDEFRHIEMHFQ